MRTVNVPDSKFRQTRAPHSVRCHTGEGRYPWSGWIPASPTDQVRGLKAHGMTSSGISRATLRMTNDERSPTLYRIRAVGVLRVGTTGDYTPFSLRRPDGSYEGADIDMAHDLAGTIGVDLEFVASVWVDLLDDFLGGRFA